MYLVDPTLNNNHQLKLKLSKYVTAIFGFNFKTPPKVATPAPYYTLYKTKTNLAEKTM